MISFRYHIVTIVAVFLALAVGLLAGSAFVQPGLVNQLRRQTDDLRDQTRQLREEVGLVRDEAADLAGFIDAALPHLAAERLIGRSAVIVVQEGVEDAVLAQTQRALSVGGATLVATISIRQAVTSQDPSTQATLAELIGQPGAFPVDLPGLTALALAERLAREPDDPSEPDLLHDLLSAGFLAPVGPGVSDETITGIGAPGQIVVVLGGGRGEEPVIAPDLFSVPLVRSLAALGVAVAAGESVETDFPFVSIIRDQGVSATVTVDDLDRSMGGAALVLGLEELLATGRGGAYGVKDGTEPLPPIP